MRSVFIKKQDTDDMEKSTSIHRLNADLGLNAAGKINWLFLNAVNNSFPSRHLDNQLKVLDFCVDDLSFDYAGFERTVSPTRMLCNLFWKRMLPTFEVELQGKIRALEIGCGTGIYGYLMNQILGGRVTYRGLDIYEDPAWGAYFGQEQYSFRKADSTNIEEYLVDANFIFTQSALEHFNEDLTFFHQLNEYSKRVKHPLIQVHLIPSTSTISTFPWHGVRQYSLRNISKITRIFGESTEKTLYKLGSAECNKLHRKWITFPNLRGVRDNRSTLIDKYENELFSAIRSDMNKPKEQAGFYALVLKSF